MLAIASQIALGYYGFPNYLFIYIILYVFVFLNARIILNSIDKLPTTITTIIGSIIVALIILLFWFDATTKYTTVWLGLVSAIIIFAVLKKIFNEAENNPLINFISTISFEIYLVHHVFCFGNYSIYHIVSNPILGTIVILIVSIILATILKRISSYISKIDYVFNKNDKRQ